MTILRCPHCGQKLELHVDPIGGQPRRKPSGLFQSSHRSIFRNQAGAVVAPAPGGYLTETQAPAAVPTMEANVTIPLLQATITGLFVGIGGLAGATFFYRWGGLSFWPALGYGALWGLGLTFVSSAFLWWDRLGYYDALLWRIETITGLDLNNDDQTGKPESHTVAVEVQQGKRWQFEHLPGEAQSVFKFAADVAAGRVTFSESGARDSGYGAESFIKLRDLFIKHGWAGWRNPDSRQQGVELYRNGLAVIRSIAGDPPPMVMADRGDDKAGMSPNYIEKGTGKGSWA